MATRSQITLGRQQWQGKSRAEKEGLPQTLTKMVSAETSLSLSLINTYVGYRPGSYFELGSLLDSRDMAGNMRQFLLSWRGLNSSKGEK